MTDLKLHTVSHDLGEAQAALVKATSALQSLPQVAASKAIHELIVANGALARALKTLAGDTSETPQLSPDTAPGTYSPAHSSVGQDRQILLDTLKRPISDLHLNTRAQNICDRTAFVVLSDGRPVRIQQGFSKLGELVQIQRGDLQYLRNCGEATVSHLVGTLGSFGIRFGMELSDIELESIGVERVFLSDQIVERAHVAEFADGAQAIRLNAREFVHRRIEELPGINSDELDRLKRINIKELSGSIRPAATVGDLIQVSRRSSMPIYTNSLMNNLLPMGLCLGMKLSDAGLAELGLGKVTFSHYNFKR